MIYQNRKENLIIKATFFAAVYENAPSTGVYIVFGEDSDTGNEKLMLAIVEKLKDGQRCIMHHADIDYEDLASCKGHYPSGVVLMTGDDEHQAYAIHVSGEDWIAVIQDTSEFGIVKTISEHITIPFT